MKTFSILSILGLALRSTPSLHHHFIIHPVLLILCLIDVKRVISFDLSSCIITHLFIESLIYFSPVKCVNHDMIVYHRIIGHVIHPQIFILLWLLIDVMLSSSSESFTRQKLRRKVGGFPQRFN
jgi:hypothetical protein